MTTRTFQRPSRTVLRVDGESHTGDAGRLEAELLPACRHNSLVILDCTGLTFLGAAGLAVVLAAHQVATLRGHRLRLVVNAPAVGAVLRVSGVLDLLDVFRSMRDALAADG
jgi:anti-sigma B factor antagonist